MKNTLMSVAAIAITLTLPTMAQTRPAPAVAAAAPAPAENGAAQIVFVPTDLLTESRASGKLKENTFYWTNAKNNPEIGPKPVQADGKTFLRILGEQTPAEKIGVSTLNRDIALEASHITVVKAFNIPTGTKSATIKTTWRSNLDVWEDPFAGKGGFWIYSVLTNNGKQISNPLPNPKKNGGWEAKQTSIDIPDKTQQLLILIGVKGGAPVDLAAAEVTFSEKTVEVPVKP